MFPWPAGHAVTDSRELTRTGETQGNPTFKSNWGNQGGMAKHLKARAEREVLAASGCRAQLYNSMV